MNIKNVIIVGLLASTPLMSNAGDLGSLAGDAVKNAAGAAADSVKGAASEAVSTAAGASDVISKGTDAASALKNIDANGDGSVTYDEYYNLMKDKVSGDKIDGLKAKYESLDADGDGSLSKAELATAALTQ